MLLGGYRHGQDAPGRGHRQLQRHPGPPGHVRGRARSAGSSARGVSARAANRAWMNGWKRSAPTPLLILDDLGAHNSTPWAQEKLFQILNHRYNGRLPTVITANQRLEELDPRIASRLADLGFSQVFEIPAPDFRAGQDSGGFDRSGAEPQFTGAAQRPDLRNLLTAGGRALGAGSAGEPAKSEQPGACALPSSRAVGWYCRAPTAAARRIWRPPSPITGWPRARRPHVRRCARPAGPPARHLQPDQHHHARSRLRAGEDGPAVDPR